MKEIWNTKIGGFSGCSPKRVPMRCSDLKRAVEDVVLRPDENRVADLRKRDTLAALDLCQLEPSPSASAAPDVTASTMNACSCSSEVVGAATSTVVMADSTARPPPPLCASSSLDAIMCRPQPSVLHRHSAGGSRRQSRVYSTLSSKRKRSNSLTNYQKSQSLSVSLPPSARTTPHRFVNEEDAFRNSIVSSDSHSSVSRSDDYTNGFVLEEEEAPIPEHPSLMHSNNSTCSSSSSYNAFTAFRTPKNYDFEDDMMDCD
ncbi:unnamed protein product [Caenorhabditis bovis]|uniref:Uncharacterized protein n=1 Tax=Caenorhabditis bovis TaxID=2654633 RepID=A0A8S1EMV0_9PELO|nr:unnamed protein product [Caenorhabditis bovis]